MKISLKRINQIATGTLGGVFAFAVIYDLIKSEPFLTTLKAIGIWIWSKLTLTIPIWLALSIAICLCLLYLAYKRFKQPKLPPFFDYREDVMRNWKWRWSYEHDGKRWDLVDLVAYCPDDDTQLSIWDGGHGAYCPLCSKQFHFNAAYPFEDKNDIERLIIRNLQIKYPNTNR